MDATTTPNDVARREPEEPHGHSVPEPHHKVNYLAIFILLVVLTVVTVAVAFIPARSIPAGPMEATVTLPRSASPSAQPGAGETQPSSRVIPFLVRRN